MSLLDQLAASCGCEYLSALYDRRPGSASALQAAAQLRRMSPEDWTPPEWQDALRYLTGGQCPATGETAEELRQQLLLYLDPQNTP